MLVVWGEPTPHDPETFVFLLCKPDLQHSTNLEFEPRHHKVGRDRLLIPSVIPAQVQGRHNKHNEKY